MVFKMRHEHYTIHFYFSTKIEEIELVQTGLLIAVESLYS